MKILQMADAIRYRTMTTEELRETFLIDDLFHAGAIGLTYVDLDRAVIGSAVPTSGPLVLPTDDALKASYFTERRELGILNIGGAGAVTVGGTPFEIKKLDGLYVGRGNEEIIFSSSDSAHPAEFYLLSYPAHATHPTQLIRSGEQAKVTLGAAETANLREITKLIHLEGTPSCQLVMGFYAARIGKCLEHDASPYAYEAIGSLSLFRPCAGPTSGSSDGPWQADTQHYDRQ